MLSLQKIWISNYLGLPTYSHFAHVIPAPFHVIPEKAGIQKILIWLHNPDLKVGYESCNRLDSRLRGNDINKVQT